MQRRNCSSSEIIAPRNTPITPPSALRVTASVRNCSRMLLRLAPMALRTPISRVRSVTETSMIFITPIPPTNEPDRGHREHQHENQVADFVPEIEKIVGSEDGEIIGLVVAQAALAAEQVADFLDRLARRLSDRWPWRISRSLFCWDRACASVVTGMMATLSSGLEPPETPWRRLSSVAITVKSCPSTVTSCADRRWQRLRGRECWRCA